jgi:Ca-activated chloride channel homolog
MKLTFSVILFLAMLIDPTKIGKINAAKAAAKKTFNEGHYKEAVKKYRYLIDSLDVDEDEVRLNLAHAYYLSKDTASAKPIYRDLTQSTNNEIRSKALQQLGVMNNSQGKADEALGQFKQAIKANPNNQDARYNYEMLKKKLDKQKKKDQQNQQNKDDKKQDQNKDQEKKDEQNKDKKDQKNEDQKNKDQKEQEKKEQEEKEKKEQEQKDQQKKNEDQKSQEEKAKEEKEKKEKQGEKDQQTEEQKEQQKKENQKLPDEVKQKLEQMNISEQKAKMILEAMKNQEVQYLQQNRRKATKPKDKGKPDW